MRKEGIRACKGAGALEQYQDGSIVYASAIWTKEQFPYSIRESLEAEHGRLQKGERPQDARFITDTGASCQAMDLYLAPDRERALGIYGMLCLGHLHEVERLMQMAREERRDTRERFPLDGKLVPADMIFETDAFDARCDCMVDTDTMEVFDMDGERVFDGKDIKGRYVQLPGEVGQYRIHAVAGPNSPEGKGFWCPVAQARDWGAYVSSVTEKEDAVWLVFQNHAGLLDTGLMDGTEWKACFRKEDGILDMLREGPDGQEEHVLYGPENPLYQELFQYAGRILGYPLTGIYGKGE